VYRSIGSVLVNEGFGRAPNVAIVHQNLLFVLAMHRIGDECIVKIESLTYFMGN
jgi:hypothetical protein